METDMFDRLAPSVRALVFLGVAGALWAFAGSARAQGEAATFSPLSIDQAIALAQTSGDNILIEVWSGHCAQCGVMDNEVWSTPDGAQITDGVIALKIDSDTYDLRRRYPVMGLPAVILLDPNGVEIDRIVGYVNKQDFLNQAAQLKLAIDPIPGLETTLASKPNSLPVMFELLETYYNRKMDEKAEAMLARIMEADPRNAAAFSEKAVMAAAKYHAYFTNDAAQSQKYWRMMAEKFPTSSGIGGALKATLDHARAQGSTDEWVKWACGVASSSPTEARLQSAVAMFAFRNGLRGQCLAESARRAKQLGLEPANMDSVATVLAGK